MVHQLIKDPPLSAPSLAIHFGFLYFFLLIKNSIYFFETESPVSQASFELTR